MWKWLTMTETTLRILGMDMYEKKDLNRYKRIRTLGNLKMNIFHQKLYFVGLYKFGIIYLKKASIFRQQEWLLFDIMF